MKFVIAQAFKIHLVHDYFAFPKHFAIQLLRAIIALQQCVEVVVQWSSETVTLSLFGWSGFSFRHFFGRLACGRVLKVWISQLSEFLLVFE